MDPRLKAAIAEIEDAACKVQPLNGKTWEAAVDCHLEIIQRHFAEPHPVIAELERELDAADRGRRSVRKDDIRAIIDGYKK